MSFEVSGFAGGLSSGLVTGLKLGSALGNSRVQGDVARAMRVNPEQTTAYTAEQGQQLEAIAAAKDENGKPYYSVGHDGKDYTVALSPDRQSGGLESMGAKVEPNSGSGEGRNAQGNSPSASYFHDNVQNSDSIQPAGLASIAPKTQYSMGGKMQEAPFTPSQIQAERLRKAADVYVMAGKPERAIQIEALAEHRRKAAETEESRAMLSKIGEGGIEHLARETPRIVGHYLKQGDVAKAKLFQEFAQSTEGQEYANQYAQANHLVTVGNYEGAIPFLQKLHSRYPDGTRADYSHVGDGKYRVDLIDEQTGKLRGSRTMAAEELSKQALNLLSPIKIVEFQAIQNAKREEQEATQSRQMLLEDRRDQRQELREDRRDNRLAMRLNEAAKQGPKLSLAQEVRNYEIDSARKRIANMSAEELRRKTAPTTATGRENPQYDPLLARDAKLASRRKYGSDDTFDTKLGEQESAASPSASNQGNDVSVRFQSDPEMKGKRLGKQTPHGIEVFDGAGKLIGHYE